MAELPHLSLFVLLFFYLSFGLAIIDTISPESTATVTPPAQAESPPVSIPVKPSLFIASRTPFASEFPKPVSGTVAPAPAKSTSLSYQPNAPNSTPRQTKSTRIFAGVSFVKSMRSCPTTQIAPPTKNGILWYNIVYSDI